MFADMPIGKHYRVTGLLLEAPRGLELEVDGGGTWVLDVDPDARRWLGKRVTVEGFRSGFDRLDVQWLGAEGHERPPPRRRWFGLL